MSAARLRAGKAWVVATLPAVPLAPIAPIAPIAVVRVVVVTRPRRLNRT
jgi:hypothetical protein